MSDPAEVITVTLGDKTFRAGRRTAAHIEWTIERLTSEHPDCRLHIIQPCYNDGVGASEGTHDFDGVIDVELDGLSWPEAQVFMRRCGWAAWWRQPWQGFTDHIHAASLGCPGPVGRYIDGGLSLFGHLVASSQYADYSAHAWGLESMHDAGSDRSWFPPDISATIFSFTDWEDRVLQSDLDKIVAAVKATQPTTDDIVTAVLAALVDGKGTTLKAAARLSADAARITIANSKGK